MEKRIRQYVGVLCAAAVYFAVHEGAHLLCAMCMGTFRAIRFLGLGIQIDVYAQAMSDMQMGIFCLSGAMATLTVGYALTAAAPAIAGSGSKMSKACMYYSTMALMLLDPLYLSILSGFFGGGDMNGIALLLPQGPARILFGMLLAGNAALFLFTVVPRYKEAFRQGIKTQGF